MLSVTSWIYFRRWSSRWTSVRLFAVGGRTFSGQDSDRLSDSVKYRPDAVEFVVGALPPDENGGVVSLNAAESGGVQQFEA